MRQVNLKIKIYSAMELWVARGKAERFKAKRYSPDNIATHEREFELVRNLTDAGTVEILICYPGKDTASLVKPLSAKYGWY